MKGKKFLGMPVSVILALALTAGAVLAAFLWSQSVPSTVKIIGSEVVAYEDEACTVELTALDFGEIRGGETTGQVEFWLKNQGDDPVYCALAEDDLDALLALFEGTDNAVPADPDRLPLLVSTSSYWQETGVTTVIEGGAVGETSTAIGIDDATSFPSSGMVKIDDELISYASISQPAEYYLLEGCVRGEDGTTPAAHAIGATVTVMEYVSGDVYNLEPDEVLAVDLYITADPDIARSDKPFTLIVEAKDTAY